MPGQFEGILDKLQTKLGKQTIRRASTINRPRPKLNVIQIKAINDFVKRNPRADGGSVNGSYEAALRKKIEELMDDGYEFGEAVREAMRQGYQKGGKVYKTKGGVTLSTEKNVKEGFIYPVRNKEGKVRWRKTSGGTKRKTNYDFTKKAPIPEMNNKRFKFDIDKNSWVYLSRSKTDPIIVKKDNETFKQFVKRKEDVRFSKMDEARNRKISNIVNAKNKIDNWTKNWLDTNLDKYGIKDKNKFINDLKKDYKKFVNKNFKTNIISGINVYSLDKLPNISRSVSEQLSPFEYEGFKTLNVGKFGGDTTKNPVKPMNNEPYLRKIFFKNRIENIPGFKEDLSNYFNYITTNKRTIVGREATKNFIPNDDVVYFLDSNKSGIDDMIKGDIMSSLGNDIKNQYDAYQYRVRAGLNWVKNAEKIEKALGPKEMKKLTGYTKIKTGMEAETKILKKIFDYKDLPDDLKLSYAIDHGQGISYAANSGNKNTMRLAVTDLIGTTNQTNEYLGRGKRGEPVSFERQRGILANKIRKKEDVTNNLKKLNTLVENTYGTKNVYSIKNGVLNASRISPTTNAASRFISYFEEIDKTKEGRNAIKKQYGDLDRLKILIRQNSKDIETVKNYALNNKGTRFNSFAGFIDFANSGIELPPAVKQASERILKTSGKFLRGAGKAAAVLDPMFAAYDFSEAIDRGVGGKEAAKYTGKRFVEGVLNLPDLVASGAKFAKDKIQGEDAQFETGTLYEPFTFAQESLDRAEAATPKSTRLRNIAERDFDVGQGATMRMVDDMEIPASKTEIDTAKEKFVESQMGPYYKYGLESMVEEEPEEKPLQNEGLLDILTNPTYKGGVIKT